MIIGGKCFIWLCSAEGIIWLYSAEGIIWLCSAEGIIWLIEILGQCFMGLIWKVLRYGTMLKVIILIKFCTQLQLES
jgi:hypothetical protein